MQLIKAQFLLNCDESIWINKSILFMLIRMRYSFEFSEVQV